MTASGVRDGHPELACDGRNEDSQHEVEENEDDAEDESDGQTGRRQHRGTSDHNHANQHRLCIRSEQLLSQKPKQMPVSAHIPSHYNYVTESPAEHRTNSRD